MVPRKIERLLEFIFILGDERSLLESIVERMKRRPIILKGISLDLDTSKISAQLGSNNWVILNDLRFMRRNGDLGLIQAKKAQVQVRDEKVLLLKEEKISFKQNERFLLMTGISLQEKSFHNMIDFNKQDLLNIHKSEDQHAAIVKLPKSVQRSLKKNGIITRRYRDNEITKKTLDYLFS